MVMERPDYASRKRNHKALVYPDGTQRIAQIGMVDAHGVSCYMLDTGDIERFKFADYNELLADMRQDVHLAELSESNAIAELESAKRDVEKVLQVMDGLLEVAFEMYYTCTFQKGTKMRINSLLNNYRRDFKALKKRIDSGDDDDED